ncbi:MAG: nuclear transport factor 2 family protein, partial [Pyrinomonadaceae bacterium]
CSLGMVFILAFAAVISAQDGGTEKKTERQQEEAKMSARENIEIILEVFSAIERRDDRRFVQLVRPDFEIHWPPSLPYGETSRGPNSKSPTWSETWIPLQPSETERKMDPRVVAASEDEVVVLWRQRGVTHTGDLFDGEVLGLYRFRGKKLSRAQMFYFDTAAVVRFLAKAKEPGAAPKP